MISADAAEKMRASLRRFQRADEQLAGQASEVSPASLREAAVEYLEAHSAHQDAIAAAGDQP